MEILKRTGILAGLLVVMTSGTGCFWLLFGVGAGAGAVGYIKGELKSEEKAELADVFKAAKKALKKLDLPVSTEKKDAITGKITSITAQEQSIEINLKQISPTITEIKIRIGLFGDETLSRMILLKIKDGI